MRGLTLFFPNESLSICTGYECVPRRLMGTTKMNYAEMHTFRQNPVALRSTARMIKAALGSSISDKELDFLTKLERFQDYDTFSTRQGEYLWGLREKTSRKSKQGGYLASHLIQLLWEARLGLEYEHEEELGRGLN